MENHTEYIDDYFNGNLNPEERKNFEKQMEIDRNLAEEVAFYLAAKQSLREELATEKKDWFRQLAQNADLSQHTRAAQVRKMWVYRIAAAAVFVGIIFFSWSIFFQASTSPDKLADKYISTQLDKLGVKMGRLDSMQEALQLYNAKQFDSALHQFQAIIERDTSNYDAKRYTGVTYLRLGRYDKALEYFQQLQTYSLAANPAIFFQALTLMKRNQPGDKEKARQLLDDVSKNELQEKETADQWLRKKW